IFFVLVTPYFLERLLMPDIGRRYKGQVLSGKKMHEGRKSLVTYFYQRESGEEHGGSHCHSC
ncbi:hypothetical protein XENOCAPTIV_000131, partial [Xenoophorus captivus]